MRRHEEKMFIKWHFFNNTDNSEALHSKKEKKKKRE